MESKRTVIDENGTVHTLLRSLGQGGQGEVWLTSNGRRVVKLFKGSARDEAVRRQIAFVKRADLSGLHVAKPLALLRAPQVGYVAEFLTDMVPMRGLLAPPRGQSVTAWYLASGGLRRRLRLLAHAGEAIMGLHARGLVYGDVSHNNVFISEPLQSEEAWLIDLDNLSSEVDRERAIYTREYGAPEVVTGKHGCTSFSDAWAFAVLAFQVLTLAHPLLGDLVNDGEPELEDEAFAGRLPWIEDAADSCNRSSNGLPRPQVLSKKLLETAAANFEGGRTERRTRPGVSAWTERLHTAADRTLRCPDCTATYYESASSCPWCGTARPRVGQVRFHRWEPAKGIVSAMGTVAQLPLPTEGVPLTRRLTHAESGMVSRRVTASLEPTQRGVILRAGQGQSCWVTDVADTIGTRPREVTERGAVLPFEEIQRSYVIHFEPLDRPHRVAVVGGPR